MYPHTHTLILTSKHSPITHLFTQSKHSISSLKVIWRKDQKLDQAIEKDKIFKQSLKVIKEVLNEPNQIIPLRYLEKRRKRLRLPVKAETFIRRNPTLFDVYYDRIRPKSDLVKFLRISDTLKRVLDRNERVYLENEGLIVAKLCKLLMMSKNNVVSADKLVHVKREFGFPNDFMESLVPRYPKYFKVVGSGEGRTFLELVSWNEVFAKSVIEKRADEESEKTGIRVRPGFDWKLPSGFFIRKEMREWIRDWMERPYVSPYEDVSNLDQASLEMEKRTVGVFHELLSLSLYNKQVVMDSTTRTSASWCLLVALVAFVISVAKAQPLVPAIMTFGDSAVDVGNNDYIATIFKANYPPYGRDFPSHKPTGRFCNGKLATDITADTLGFTTYPPAYLSPEASGKNLLIGANFASAGSGYDEKTAALSHAISLQQQLQYYKEYQGKLVKVAGGSKAASIFKDALYLISAGNSDFAQNYYVNPFINKVYTPDQYGNYLVGIFQSFVKDLYGLGARRIGVTSLPPLGCLPVVRTLFGSHEKGCVSNINTDAQAFNKKVNAAATQLGKQLPGLKIVIFDIFQPLYDLVKNPSSQGFVEATRGCCGTGTVETTVFLCNPKSPGTCSNATQYVFWDSVHPSQAANQILADALLLQGIALIS